MNLSDKAEQKIINNVMAMSERIDASEISNNAIACAPDMSEGVDSSEIFFSGTTTPCKGKDERLRASEFCSLGMEVENFIESSLSTFTGGKRQYVWEEVAATQARLFDIGNNSFDMVNASLPEHTEQSSKRKEIHDYLLTEEESRMHLQETNDSFAGVTLKSKNSEESSGIPLSNDEFTGNCNVLGMNLHVIATY
eukprot:CAMPEP_0194330794 /NCGR_PEP_ID=MMETSP0171-20130528/53283_1 /TAXON_ID=218684 /ORGANISM="Corethron pennatum, Strain L29A3" /LENGTH=194 /DNA_ID=CAMNT_0039091989 /DNA_START=566 /DNA_END=1150 /DNA_ORIENTATION=+